MFARFRSYVRQNHLGLIAIFIALGGTGAYAANTIRSGDIVDGQVKNQDLANDSVGTGKLKPAAVGNADLAPNSIGTGKVIDGSLLKDDFKAGQLPKGDKGDPCPPTNAACRGPKGDTGDRGPGAISYESLGRSEFGGYQFVQHVNGITLTWSCTATRAFWSLRGDVFGQEDTISVIGIRHNDYGAPQSVNRYEQDVHFYEGNVPTNQYSTNYAGVIAKAEQVDKWTRFDLGSLRGPNGKCDFWGTITPPS